MDNISERIKRRIKNYLPFSLRHKLQIMAVKHSNWKLNFSRQKTFEGEYITNFDILMDKLCNGVVKDKVVCEVGPGQYLYNAFFLYQLGAKHTYMIDIENLAESDSHEISHYFDGRLNRDDCVRKLPRWNKTDSLNDFLDIINTDYYTEGLKSYAGIPDNSVDLLFSNAVLQHIRKKEFEKNIAEQYRIIKTGGVAYHTIDLRDMMGGMKRQLEINEEVWEDKWHYLMPCYTNRLQCNEICNVFGNIGFTIVVVERRYFERTPVNFRKLSKEFKTIEEQELMTSGIHIKVRK